MSHKNSVESLLTALHLKALNDMQQATLETAAQHPDLMLLSATGSGKTLAFLLPIIQNLDANNKKTQALIMAPSRELALQIEQVVRNMGTGFKATCCYGGHKRETEENNLLEAPALIIGTPGRIADHIRRNNITTDTIHTLVLDEFDKILELGFRDEVSFIVSSLPALSKRILTSATTAPELPDFIPQDIVQLNFLTEGETAAALDIRFIRSKEKDKIDTLFQLICSLGSRSTIIFCNHREAVERTSALLSGKGIINTFYHGAMEQRDREVALAKFRNGSSLVLVTTDLAARGLDIPNIRYIIHYHLPTTEDIFTHRNGRTARMEASGTAILIINSEEKLPPYLNTTATEIVLTETYPVPEKPRWTTIFIGAGKKDKVNKVDIVGFFSNRGELKKEDIGLIEVKDFFSFVALRKSRVNHVLQLIKEQKIKNRKVKIDVAK
jgi:ATP-independent RNA helicase DbpA